MKLYTTDIAELSKQARVKFLALRLPKMVNKLTSTPIT